MMVKELMLEKSFTIEAPVEKVWDALTNPAMVKEYFFGTDLVTNWKVGSPIYFRGEWEGKQYEDKGKVLQYEANKFLEYNYWSSMSGTEDVEGNYANITYSVKEKDGKTVLTVTQNKIQSEEALDHSGENWASVMNAMKAIVEKKS